MAVPVLILSCLSSLVLAAHCIFRGQNSGMMPMMVGLQRDMTPMVVVGGAILALYGLGLLVSLASAVIVWVRRPWAGKWMQFVLIVGSLELARATFFLVQDRLDNDRPWIRMALILGAVSLVMLLSGLGMRLPAVKRYHGSHKA